MSKKSPTSSRRKAKTAPDRPFDADTLKRAKKIASTYRLVLEKNEAVGFVGSSIELPTVFTDGLTPASCVESTQQALVYAVATMLESGQNPPAAASMQRRNVQVNVRLTAQEKLRLTEAARRQGFKGVSDFVRIAALDRTNAA